MLPRSFTHGPVAVSASVIIVFSINGSNAGDARAAGPQVSAERIAAGVSAPPVTDPAGGPIAAAR